MKIIRLSITQIILLLLALFVMQSNYSADYQKKGMTRLPTKQELSVFKKEDRVAVVVGISQYHPNSGFRSLDYAVDDAKLLEEAFNKQGYRVKLLINNAAKKQFILDAIDQMGKLLIDPINPDEKKGTLVFVFTGHGFADNDNINYLAVDGTTRKNISESGLTLDLIQQHLQKSGARRNMIFIDACRDNPIRGRSVSNLSFSNLDDSQGLNILYSSAQGKVSYESPLLGHGIFSYFLVKGLQGEAEEAKKKGIIVFDDLANYVSRKVREWSSANLPYTQIPYRSGESAGNFLIGFTNVEQINNNPRKINPLYDSALVILIVVLCFVAGMFFSGALKVIYYLSLPVFLYYLYIYESKFLYIGSYFSGAIYFVICLILLLVIVLSLPSKIKKPQASTKTKMKGRVYEAKLEESILSGEEGKVNFLSNGMMFSKLAKNKSTQNYMKGSKVIIHIDTNGNLIIS